MATRPPVHWQEVEDGGGPGGLGQQCQARWAAGKPGGFFLSLCFSNSVLFSVLQVCFEFGFETNSILLLLEIFLEAKRIKPKLHKIFQNYWTYIYLIVDINPIQIVIDLIQMPKINVSETPKILVWILPLANISRG